MKPTRKKCPIQPCPERIPARWVTCEFHWREYVPEKIREANKAAYRAKDSSRATYTAVLGLCCIWSFLEEAGLSVPPEHVGSPWTCRCRSCAPIFKRALRTVNIHDDGVWAYLTQRLGISVPAEVA